MHQTLYWIFLCWILINLISPYGVNGEAHCWKKKYYSTLSGIAINATVKCTQNFQWTVADQCCYDVYDRFDNRPSCCYSETYKLVIAIGIICLILLCTSCFLFLCWVYNLPHHLLYLLTCRKFNLNDWMKVHMNGPYVDPAYYENFHWSRGSSEYPFHSFPLRPMPPRIFYPSQKAGVRWENHGITPQEHQIPLFVLASRQFLRNPYSARPRQSIINSSTPTPHSNPNDMAPSRRSSTFSISDNQRYWPNVGYNINIDEVDAAAELLSAIQMLDEKDKVFALNNDNRIIPTAPNQDSKIEEVIENSSIVPYTIDGSMDIQEDIEHELLRRIPQHEVEEIGFGGSVVSAIRNEMHHKEVGFENAALESVPEPQGDPGFNKTDESRERIDSGRDKTSSTSPTYYDTSIPGSIPEPTNTKLRF